MESPKYDIDEAFDKIQDKLYSKKVSKVVKLRLTLLYKVAASVAILFGLVYFLNSTTVYKTAYSEHLNITLPDNSIVQLNSNSEIKFNKRTFENDRKLFLKGEAFFKVEKGSDFKVITSEGTIEVLGTKFIVISQKEYLEVQCYEGKVRVNANEEQVVLTSTNAYRTIKDISETWDFGNPKPTWLYGESTFTNTPLKQVITALENEFDIQFIEGNISVDKRFSGSFTHSDLKLALKTVFVPMEISFTFNGENSIALVQK